MIRTLTTLSVLAMAVALAAPASAETSVLVTLTGKTTPAIYADITRAAHTICKSEAGRDLSFAYCVKLTMAQTLAKIGRPALNQYARSQDAALRLASN